MILKAVDFFRARDYYKIAIIIVCANALFELVFQYRFETEMEVVYFLILGAVSASAVKIVLKKNTGRYLPLFYCFWPMIIVFVSLMSSCKLALLPLLISSFILFFFGSFRKKLIKTVAAAVMAVPIAVIVLGLGAIILSGHGFVLSMGFSSETEVKETVYSPDNKYIMVVEETDFFLGGDTTVYAGRNLDFGYLGRYRPRRMKYYGHTDEWPELLFIDDGWISINGEVIAIKGKSYIDDY